jgi:hypothetical protein
MTTAQQRQGKKGIHSWKGARPLLEQWREELRTLIRVWPVPLVQPEMERERFPLVSIPPFHVHPSQLPGSP